MGFDKSLSAGLTHPDSPGSGGKLSQGPSEITGHTGVFSPGLTCPLGFGDRGGTRPSPTLGLGPQLQTRQESAMALSWLAVWGYT